MSARPRHGALPLYAATLRMRRRAPSRANGSTGRCARSGDGHRRSEIAQMLLSARVACSAEQRPAALRRSNYEVGAAPPRWRERPPQRALRPQGRRVRARGAPRPSTAQLPWRPARPDGRLLRPTQASASPRRTTPQRGSGGRGAGHGVALLVPPRHRPTVALSTLIRACVARSAFGRRRLLGVDGPPRRALKRL
eukprot:scaffold43492_cov23-Tisochrysis_lutea.AAC.7